MASVEIDFVVTDCLLALDFYEGFFDIARVEVTDNQAGSNEAIFTMYGCRFHMLDENPAFYLIAPKPGDPKSMWVNIVLDDIQQCYDKALAAGCTEIQGVTENAALGLSNAIFVDPFGYIWMLHEMHNE
ncbi:MAG: VOC family protein [Coriobacteriia bacterium]|nr:VOC family protein [Coriobacteriia bacterium]